ncbi:MAG: NADPH-dependent FMN reductase [Chlorobiaceae bacterium]|jgi:multimeric flavodoxin WrbA|nr:NADPH-dependent FMN reductase [Chlorobiaceae bacterium]
MKILILDGSPSGDATGVRIAGNLVDLLAASGHQAEHVVLRDKTIANCNGCFQCWLKTPGICAIDDDNRDLVAKYIQSDIAIALTPLTFGAFSPELKKFADHLIQTISPFFCKVNGETHHRQRYERYPGFISIGWLQGPDDTQERIFRHLFYRNTINFYTEKDACGILYSTMGDQKIRENLNELLHKAVSGKNGSSRQPPPVPEFRASASVQGPVRSATLLVGSPRMVKSTSGALGGYIAERLAESGVRTDTFQLYKVSGNPDRTRAMLESIDKTDLVILAFPLYIDSIPAPVLSVMRTIKDHRNNIALQGRLVAIANCGFIESQHNENALASCAVFAKESEFSWMGSVSIGGGEGLVHGKPLRELGGPAIPYKKNLDLVAAALAMGKPVPEEARKQLAKPFTPGWIYRAIGSMGWKKEARKNGIVQQLSARPYRKVPA